MAILNQAAKCHQFIRVSVIPSSGGRKSKLGEQAEWVPGEGPLPGLQMVICLLCPPIVGKGWVGREGGARQRERGGQGEGGRGGGREREGGKEGKRWGREGEGRRDGGKGGEGWGKERNGGREKARRKGGGKGRRGDGELRCLFLQGQGSICERSTHELSSTTRCGNVGVTT